VTAGHVNTYVLGDIVVLSVAFRDPTTGALTDPPGVNVLILLPGVRPALEFVFGVDVEVVNDAVGLYHMNYTTERERNHRYRWEGTGAIGAAMEGSFIVCDSDFF